MILRKRNKSILIIYSGLDGLINRISSDQRTVFVICFYDFKILVNVEQRWASDHPDIVDMKQTKHGRLISLSTKAYVVETMTIKKNLLCLLQSQFSVYQVLRNHWCGDRLKIWASWQSIFLCLLVDNRPISALLTIISLFACQWHLQTTISVSFAKKPYQKKLKLPKRTKLCA